MMNEQMKPKMDRKKKLLIICVAVVVIITAGVGGFLIYDNMKQADPVKAEAAYLEIQDAVIDGKVDPYGNTVQFDALWDINEDVCAWITVPGTNVDYPVLYSTEKDDSYYLNYTIDGKAGLPGSIYIEKYNSNGFTDPVTLMYGHTFSGEEETMFTQLHRYSDEEFFEENEYFYVYMPEATLKYEVFAAVAFDDRYILGSYDFSKQEDFEQYIADLEGCMTGHVDEEADVKYGDAVLTLSTCITEYPSQRWLINGVLRDVKVIEAEQEE